MTTGEAESEFFGLKKNPVSRETGFFRLFAAPCEKQLLQFVQLYSTIFRPSFSRAVIGNRVSIAKTPG